MNDKNELHKKCIQEKQEQLFDFLGQLEKLRKRHMEAEHVWQKDKANLIADSRRERNELLNRIAELEHRQVVNERKRLQEIEHRFNQIVAFNDAFELALIESYRVKNETPVLLLKWYELKAQLKDGDNE